MSCFDGRRLPVRVFKIDIKRMRAGWYSDQYFINVAKILERLAAEKYRFSGSCPTFEKKGINPSKVEVGNLHVEMQYFTKRKPFSIAAGIDHAIAILKECTGCFTPRGRFVSTFKALEVDAVEDGRKLAPWAPAMKVRGRYRDFAILETTTLGVMARRTRIATNTYEALKAARGKPVLFFPARFDVPETQAGDGYAYMIGVERYNRDYGTKLAPLVTSRAQGSWWHARGGGTVSHSFILCFLRDTAEAMMHFARILPAEIKRIALVDTNNDCVGDSLKTAERMFEKYMELKTKGRPAEAKKYILFGVRADTAGEMRDVSVEPTGDDENDRGVNPRLVFKLRSALDNLADRIGYEGKTLSEARRYFRNIKIVVSGGFTPEKIARFERRKAPADIYGVGSSFLKGPGNNFIADVVRVKIQGGWRPMAKVGRRARQNKDLKRIR